MVPANRQNGRVGLQETDQVTKVVEFRRLIDQITAQQHTVGFGLSDGLNHLPSEMLRAFRPKVNIADVHQPTRVLPCRNALLTNVKGASKTDLQPWGRHRGS